MYSFWANYPLQRITRKKIFYNISSFILRHFKETAISGSSGVIT